MRSCVRSRTDIFFENCGTGSGETLRAAHAYWHCVLAERGTTHWQQGINSGPLPYEHLRLSEATRFLGVPSASGRGSGYARVRVRVKGYISLCLGHFCGVDIISRAAYLL